MTITTSPDEHEPPRVVRRHPAADHGADRDRGAGDTADDPVGEGTILPLIVRRDQSGDGRDHQNGAEAFDERPAEEQDVQVRAQRRRQRAKPVDRETDGEGTVATPDVAELRSHEHERRHHQRVGGDRGLHARDGRVEVGHDLRDRDVHHARVEHHHELRSREDDQGEPAAHQAESTASASLEKHAGVGGSQFPALTPPKGSRNDGCDDLGMQIQEPAKGKHQVNGDQREIQTFRC